MAMHSSMLEIRGLTKSYGDVQALRGVDLDLTEGQVLCLLGPNGAGKTTLVSIVAGLRRADSGSVRVGDVDALASPHQARQLIGLAPQDLGVYPIVSARNNLVLFGEISGLKGAELRGRIDEISEALGLAPLLDRLAGTLSGGERRRLHTAIALLHRPPLLLLDEATTGADVQTRRDLLDVVRKLAAEGSAILYSTHYLPEVEALNADVFILEEGSPIAKGPVRDLIAAHSHGAIELVFEGPAPDLTMPEEVQTDGSLLRITSDTPGATSARALAALETDADRLRSVEIIQPSLETVYLALTGKRYSADGSEQEEGESVTTS